MEQLVSQNWEWFLTAAAGGGAFFYMLRNLGQRLDKHETKIDASFSRLHNKVNDHDRVLSELRQRVAVVEAKTEAIATMQHRLDDIWKYVMRNGLRRNDDAE